MFGFRVVLKFKEGVLKGVVSHVEHIDRIVLTLILACRLLLDNVARIFNPAGLLCPILVLAKLLMRMICCGKITNWNDPDPDDSAIKWMVLSLALRVGKREISTQSLA